MWLLFEFYLSTDIDNIIYCQADGTVTGYSNKEVTGYETVYVKNIGKILCDSNADVTDPTATLPWTPTVVRANLGLLN